MCPAWFINYCSFRQSVMTATERTGLRSFSCQKKIWGIRGREKERKWKKSVTAFAGQIRGCGWITAWGNAGSRSISAEYAVTLIDRVSVGWSESEEISVSSSFAVQKDRKNSRTFNPLLRQTYHILSYGMWCVMSCQLMSLHMISCQVVIWSYDAMIVWCYVTPYDARFYHTISWGRTGHPRMTPVAVRSPFRMLKCPWTGHSTPLNLT